MAHHQHVHVHGFQIAQGVEQGFALAGRGVLDVQVEDVRRQSLGGQLEGHPRAGAGLEEEVDHGLAAQQRHLADRALSDRDEGGGGVQDFQHQLAAQAIDGQQVAQSSGLIDL